jgi:hypothetical protein
MAGMTEGAPPMRTFYFDEWGSPEHAAEVEAGRPWGMAPRPGDQPEPTREQPTEWPRTGWTEIGATTDGAGVAALFRHR